MEETQRLLERISQLKGSEDTSALRALLQDTQRHLQQHTPEGGTQKALQTAATIQRSMIPTSVVTLGGLRATGLYCPSEGYCSGDWWTANSLGQGNGLIFIGDVTGHGTGPALVASMVKGACDLARLGMRGSLKSNQLAAMLNVVLHQTFAGQYLMTGIAALWHDQSGTLSMTNAGHRWALVIRDGKVSTWSGARSPPLGSTVNHSYQAEDISLNPGDRLILYTDGVVECASVDDDVEFGEKAFVDLVQPIANAPSEQILQQIKEAVYRHRGADSLDDDVTVVVLDRVSE